ncbi:23S rRNA pseudouridine1911/1915/1917 synthase [Melghirimyces profundicolus]|uniref:Pseudouridine synthase n=1 Tax=Melghirimyces profundicolus TaxID=1242148 RepID=A0A2T6B614_9BACL|nr:RluA family pseudouridine synthase [Melghirimyces profundicolus]PTX51497.1 23S rRNA pseudouridine1911/1915/1917 synthase [Melghirimyces profundicolus]
MGEAPSMVHRVREEEEGKMVRQVLKNRFRFSRRMFRRLKEAQAVEVNGKPAYLTSRLRAGDLIRVRLPEDSGEGVRPQPVPIHVHHEDEDLIVLDKQPGVVVHPTKRYPDGTLANGLAHYWRERGEFHLVRPVTRLDRDTSGLIVFAKHAHAHAVLSGQMKKKRYVREYLAVVHGVLPSDGGMVEEPIARSKENPHLRSVDPDGVKAVTRYRVVERLQDATLIRLRLETGRTHQIRVHMAHLGHPLVGDAMYGGETESLKRQALHAAYLRLIHPRTGETCSWESPLPRDMLDLLDRLKPC